MRSRPRATCLAAMMPAALLGLGAAPAAGGQARGTLGVTVQVVSPCGASSAGSAVTLDSTCGADAAPLAIRREAAVDAPESGAQAADAAAAVTTEGSGAEGFLTVIY
jgi:uncharacterized Ntn-hydrolase superfamily protein